jgi:hypothetical protein
VTELKLNRWVLFIIALGFCLNSGQAPAQNQLCSQVFETDKAPDILELLNTPENNGQGKALLSKLKKEEVKDLTVTLLLGAIESHPRLNSGYSPVFFAKGGPLRMGHTSLEIRQIFKKILERPLEIQRRSLQRLWAEMNAGGREFFQFYRDKKLENKKINLMSTEGEFESSRFISFDTATGFVFVKVEGSQKTDRISGASFYERLEISQREAFGFNQHVLPESEWFKVVAKKTVGKDGNLFYAEIKKEVPNATYEIQTMDVALEAETRQYTNGIFPYTRIPILATITSKLPVFAETFKIKIFKKQNEVVVQYPDINLINHILDSLPKDKSTSARLIATGRFGAVPLKAFAKSWAKNGQIYMTEQGTGHFHDVSLHLLAYLAIPPEIVLANRAHVDFWLRIAENKDLQKNVSLQKMAENKISSWAENFDNVTGRFIERIANRSITEVDSVLKDYISSLNQDNAKAYIEVLYQNPDQPWNPVKLSGQDIEIIRSLPLIADKVPEQQISELVLKSRQLLFLPLN